MSKKSYDSLDVDTNELDRIAKLYEKDLQSVIDDVKKHWDVIGKDAEYQINQILTAKEKSEFRRNIEAILSDDLYLDDSRIQKTAKNYLERPVLRREDYLEFNLRKVISRIKQEKKSKIISSLYNIWLDAKKMSVRLTDTYFLISGYDLIFKSMGENFIGSSISSEEKLKEYKRMGLKYYQIITVMDSKTTDIYIKHDLKTYRVDKAEIGVNMPPFFDGCRCSTKSSYIDDRSKVHQEHKQKETKAGRLYSLIKKMLK